jgi:hypothetical protein
MRYSVLLFTALISFAACKNQKKDSNYTYPSSSSSNSPSDYSSSNENEEKQKTYSDGDYCANVTYHNPNTGTTSTYQLTVEVEDGELTVIHWPNGGWLDATHFTPEEVDEDGVVNFTSDKGYNYEVQIESNGPCSFVSRNAVSAEEQDDKYAQDQEEAERTHRDENAGVVIWDYSSCDYIIIETGLWYVVAEKRVGAYFLDKGEKVRGDLKSFGFKDVYSFSRDEEVSLYIEDYYGSKSEALKEVMEKCGLVNEEDQ